MGSVTVQYGIVEGSRFVFRGLFSIGYLLIHLLDLQLLFCLGHYAEEGQFLLDAGFLLRESQLFAVVAHSGSAHGFIGGKSFVESVILSFDVVGSYKKIVVLYEHVAVFLY